MVQRSLRRLPAWCVLLALALLSGMAFAAEKAADPAAALAAVLGGDPAAWKLSAKHYEMQTLGNRPALTPARTLVVESTAGYTAPMEYTFAFKLLPQGTGRASVSCNVACADLPDTTKQSLAFSVSAQGGNARIGYSRALVGLGAGIKTGPGADARSGGLSLDAVGERSLTWPEEMRKTIEAQIARAPKIEEVTFTVRILLNRDKARIWLNGRLVDETPLKAGAAPDGAIRVQLSADTALLAVRAQPPAQVDPRFELVSIGGHLNAAGAPTGGKMTTFTLPDAPQQSLAGQLLTLKNTPFLFPEVDDRGNDHIDVGASWSRFGAIKGYIPANRGLFGGRWSGVDRLDPSRIALYVPYGQYTALHLVAAADGEANSVPIVSAQFFRPAAGHPMNFSGTAPLFTDGKAKVDGISVQVERGKSGRLHHITIPLDPDKMTWFSDLGLVGLELTKEVKPYRAYPDPLEYSWHAAGLPSGVHIYAMTLERAGIDADLQPDAVSHVWTAPAQPGYTVTLRNRTGQATTASLALRTASKDGKDATIHLQTVALPANDTPVTVKFPRLGVKRYGLHEVKLTVTSGQEAQAYTRNLAFLAPDTRERGNWAEGKGPIFGYWAWGGGHDTPGRLHEMTIMAAAGAETSTKAFVKGKTPDDEYALAEQLKMHTSAAVEHRSIYSTLFFNKMAPLYNPDDPEGTGKILIENLKEMLIPAGPLADPQYIAFFPEPQIGPITAAIPPTYYGEPDYQLAEADQAKFQAMLTKFLIGARAVRKEWPNMKILLPYGDPMYTVVFLKHSEEARKYIDGVAIDVPNFERLPEAQIHQVVLNRLYITLKEIRSYINNPFLVVTEGPSVSSKDIDMSDDEQADLGIRAFLQMMSLGIYNHESSNAPFDCANYWGENHYGGGWMSRLPHAMPKQAYVAYATMTRHLNRANFAKALPTGSTSVYCQQYKHYQSGKLIHVFWTIRGTRPVSVKVAPNTVLQVYDENDNATELKEKDGVVTFTIDQSPCYLEGLTGDAQITLGAPDHSDAAPAPLAKKLANLGDGSWKLDAARDETYENNNPLQIVRFPVNMTAKAENAPNAQGGKALAIRLGAQEKDRAVMPYYTTLTPKQAITIPGKGFALGLWVKGNSDWGRLVYSLRDAKGERWISIGSKENWNCDDIHAWSYFNFDGWRYLRFQLPNNSPFDCYREIGSSWWGSYGGDNIVDYPVKLEKIFVERRTKVIYNGALAPTDTGDVLLGDLMVEYEQPADMSQEMEKLSRLRMPLPKEEPVIANPIAEMAQTGVGEATQILKVTDPDHQYDGTRCHVHFTPVEGAKSYEVWVSPYADGRGALQLGKGWTASGGLIQNLRADTTFYAFVVYTDKDDKVSKPSKPFMFQLKDRFGYK